MNTNLTTAEQFAEVHEHLQKVQADYARGTNNQMGMPGHLRSVASMLDETKEKITSLQQAIRSEAQQWNDAFQGGRRRRRTTRRKRN